MQLETEGSGTDGSVGQKKNINVLFNLLHYVLYTAESL
jgi:hypothetical protein